MESSVNFVETTMISTRIRFARNLSGYVFPQKLTCEKADEIVDKVGDTLRKIDDYKKYLMREISDEDATLLKEKYLISKALIGRKKISAAYISSDREVSVMVNEEDHLREQYILKGFDLMKAYERLSQIDDELGQSLHFAYDEKIGYLTACPSNIGTGMRASVLMFLPALEKYGSLKKLIPSLKKNGLTVRGGFGEGTNADGSTYQISNERTLGFTEPDILSHMKEVALNLADLEIRQREIMLKENKNEYLDVCLRSYGVLTNCASLPIEELTEGLYKIRLGAALGFFKVEDVNSFNDFVANMRPMSFRQGNCPNVSNVEENRLRAEICNKVLPTLVKRID